MATGRSSGGGGARTSRAAGATKNLRAISLSLVAKVRSQRVTTSTALANELAREAVAECIGGGGAGPAARAALEKNVRRRLYDSLKVLVSVGAISRVRRDKTLRWNGVAHLRRARVAGGGGGGGGAALQARVAGARARVRAKAATLRALRGQGAAVRALCARNRARAAANAAPDELRVHVPFVVVRAPERSKIQLDATPDAKRLKFEFDSYFEVVNDSGIIHRLFPAEKLAPLDVAPHPSVALPLRKRAYAIPPTDIMNGFDRVLPHEIGPIRVEGPQMAGAEQEVELDVDVDVDMDEEAEQDPWDLPLPEVEL